MLFNKTHQKIEGVYQIGAEDVAQETFLCAFQSLGSLKNRDVLAPWMRTIARNRALGWLREQKMIAPLAAAPLQRAKYEDPAAEREAELFPGDIGRIVASLPETTRLPLILCGCIDYPMEFGENSPTMQHDHVSRVADARSRGAVFFLVQSGSCCDNR